MKAEQSYFFCYSKRMLGYLKGKGFSYICCAMHEKTGNKFWLFERNPRLQEALDNYID